MLLENKFHYRKGGSETYYFNLAEGLRRMGHEVVFFAMDDPQNEPCEQSKFFVSSKDYNGHISTKQKIKNATSLIYSEESKDKFEKLLQVERPDVIHLNLVHRQITFSILDAPSACDIPVVYTAHDYVPICPSGVMLDSNGNVCEDCLMGSFKPCLQKKCVKGSVAKSALAVMEADYLRKHNTYSKLDRVIAPSDFMRTKLLEGGFSPSQVVVMQNFVDSNLLELAKRTDNAPKEKYFLYFGRLSKEKGVDIAIKAFVQAAHKLPETWRLVVAGDGPEREYANELVTKSGCANRITLTGRLDKNEMQKYVDSAFFSIVSSRCRENMPYSITESFAASTPVIGADIGGIPELVFDGVTGYLCEPSNVSSLAEAMEKSANITIEKYENMQSNCQLYIQERCSQGRYMKDLIRLYGALIAERENSSIY